MIAEEGAPGAAAEHKGLHECAFGLHGMHQIVPGPCLKHLAQRHSAQFRMLRGPGQILRAHLSEQGQVLLAILREHSGKLCGSLRREVGVWLLRIKIGKVLTCQKSAETNGKERAFRVHQVAQAIQRRPLARQRLATQQIGRKRADQALPAFRRASEHRLHML